MPYINVKMVKGRTAEQKQAIIAGMTKVISEVLNKDPEATYVVIDEVDAENWGIGGASIAQRNRSGARGRS